MGHTYSCIFIHYVWSTKGRAELIAPEWEERLFSYLGGICRNIDCTLIRANGMPDHVHLLVQLPTTKSIAQTANALKANSSSWIHDNFPASGNFGWQIGYGAFSVSKSQVVAVCRYIDRQKEHHRIKPFQEEHLAFLERNEIEYDPKYVFD